MTATGTTRNEIQDLLRAGTDPLLAASIIAGLLLPQVLTDIVWSTLKVEIGNERALGLEATGGARMSLADIIILQVSLLHLIEDMIRSIKRTRRIRNTGRRVANRLRKRRNSKCKQDSLRLGWLPLSKALPIPIAWTISICLTMMLEVIVIVSR